MIIFFRFPFQRFLLDQVVADEAVELQFRRFLVAAFQPHAVEVEPLLAVLAAYFKYVPFIIRILLQIMYFPLLNFWRQMQCRATSWVLDSPSA